MQKSKFEVIGLGVMEKSLSLNSTENNFDIMSVYNKIEALNTLWAAYNYWIAITTENLTANLMQAQCHFFGAHTYQCSDDASLKIPHTNWFA